MPPTSINQERQRGGLAPLEEKWADVPVWWPPAPDYSWQSKERFYPKLTAAQIAAEVERTLDKAKQRIKGEVA